MTKSYLFEGDIMSLVRLRQTPYGSYDERESSRINFYNVIESQHLDERKFKGKLNLRAVFYVPFPQGTTVPKMKQGEGRYFTNKPSLNVFLHAFENLLSGFIMVEGSTLVQATVEKRQSMTPRVEFTLTEIE